jgi:hypothetical protein
MALFAPLFASLFASLTHKERILQLLAEIDSLLLSRRTEKLDEFSTIVDQPVENFSDVFHNSGILVVSNY